MSKTSEEDIGENYQKSFGPIDNIEENIEGDEEDQSPKQILKEASQFMSAIHIGKVPYDPSFTYDCVSDPVLG